MSRPPARTTPPIKASRPPNRPKGRTTPARPGPTAPDSDAAPGSFPPGEGLGPSGRRVTLAVVAGAHGVTGEVRLKLFTDDLSRYRRFNGGALTLTSLREGSNGAIARFAESPDRNAAEKLRGTELTVGRDELPPLEEGEYYHVDLVDLLCATEAGEPIGRVVAVENFGAGDILEIERPDGRRLMIPVAAAVIGERAVIDAAFVD